MVYTWTHGIDNTHEIDLHSWYSNVIGKDSWCRHGLMVLVGTHVKDMDSLLTTPIVLTKTPGIESVLLNHTHTRGPSVARMRDFH